MAKIIPFCALRYNQAKIKHFDTVVTPPYDVISGFKQSQLYKADRHNFIRIILGKENKSDNPAHNKYTRARDFLIRWLNQGILIKDNRPSIYIYEQVFNFEGKRLSRIGFIALLKLEPPGKGVVFPHEKTFCKPKEDRLNLLKAVKANLSPLFSLYSDNSFKIDTLLSDYSKGRPLAQLKFEGIENRLWRISDEDFIRRLASLMSNKKIFIADGHHRYEVACFYKKLIGKSQTLNADRVMMYFCNLKSEGLKILPTHRVVRHIPKDKLNKFIRLLSPYFIIQGCVSRKELFLKLKEIKNNQQVFGLYSGNKRFYLLSLIPRKIRCVSRAGIRCYNRLDVVLLHTLILHKLLGIKERNKGGSGIFYTRDAAEAIALVDSQKYQAAFFMNPPKLTQVSAIANGLKMMPHKSTYFYPKPVSGLVINKLEKCRYSSQNTQLSK